jgi:hypothetical protein
MGKKGEFPRRGDNLNSANKNQCKKPEISEERGCRENGIRRLQAGEKRTTFSSRGDVVKNRGASLKEPS